MDKHRTKERFKNLLKSETSTWEEIQKMKREIEEFDHSFKRLLAGKIKPEHPLYFLFEEMQISPDNSLIINEEKGKNSKKESSPGRSERFFWMLTRKLSGGSVCPLCNTAIPDNDQGVKCPVCQLDILRIDLRVEYAFITMKGVPEQGEWHTDLFFRILSSLENTLNEEKNNILGIKVAGEYFMISFDGNGYYVRDFKSGSLFLRSPVIMKTWRAINMLMYSRKTIQYRIGQKTGR